MAFHPYKTLKSTAFDEYTVNRSRFIGYAAPCESEEEAIQFIRSIREKHRDANHNCYAYILGENAGIMRYSDDGEPSGTAGMPILEVLRKNELVNCCAVVTRYFGGILLGAGGLVRAYSHSTVIGIRAAVPILMEPTVSLLWDVPYSLWDRFNYTLQNLPVRTEDTSFGASVQATVAVRTRNVQQVIQDLITVTDGRSEYLQADENYSAWETKISEDL